MGEQRVYQVTIERHTSALVYVLAPDEAAARADAAELAEYEDFFESRPDDLTASPVDPTDTLSQMVWSGGPRGGWLFPEEARRG